MSRFAVQTGQAVTRQFAPASRAIFISLSTIFVTIERLRDRQAPAAAVGLEGPGTRLGPELVQDLVQEDRVFRVVELADVGRPQEQAAVVGDGFQPRERLYDLLLEGLQADVLDDDVDRIPDGHAPLVLAADDLLDLGLQRRVMA